MISQPFAAPAKLNLFLHVTGRRDDGYHLLQTVFRLIDLQDTIWITPDSDPAIVHENPLPDVPAESDLMVRAAKLLQAHTSCRQGARLRIEKRIPMGGGLGGGSSDAATVLMALNHLWQLNLPREELQQLGLRLGADVPVFIFGRDAWAEGVGESLQAISLPPRWYIVLKPPVHVATADIFSSPNLTRNTKPIIMAAFPTQPLRNDLEAVATEKFPVIAEYLSWLNQHGNAMMTGSGACIFAEFFSEEKANSVLECLPSQMQGYVAQSLTHHPLLNLLPD